MAQYDEQYDELVAVYQAEGSLMGQLRATIDTLKREEYCPLAAISHDMGAEKAAFSRLTSALSVRFSSRHLDELEADQWALVHDRAPCVLGHDDQGWHVVITRGHLQQCEGSVSRFKALLQSLLATDLNSSHQDEKS